MPGLTYVEVPQTGRLFTVDVFNERGELEGRGRSLASYEDARKAYDLMIASMRAQVKMFDDIFGVAS